MLLDAERWKPAEIPLEFQNLVNQIASNKILKEIPSPLKDQEEKGFSSDNKISNSLFIDNHNFVTIGMYDNIVCFIFIQVFGT